MRGIYSLFVGVHLTAWASAAEEGSSRMGAGDIPRGPLEIPARIAEDSRMKEATFDFARLDAVWQPWNQWKAALAEDYGFRFGLDYQPAVQWSDSSIGEDFATGAIFRAYSSWDIWGRDNPSRTGTFEFQVENRSAYGSELEPESLAPNFGWIGTSAADWSDQGWGIPRFMLRQRLDIGDAPIEIRLGKMIPFSQFDVTPYSDNLTGFQNNSMIFNPTIAYTQPGAWGGAAYVGIPDSKFYVMAMLQDANGQFTEFGLADNGELFKGLEFGWTDQDVAGPAYLMNNVHVALWHIDDDSWGAALTGTYTFEEQRLGTFVRVGWAESGGRSVYQRYAAAGVVQSVFKDSAIGLAASWGQPQAIDEDQIGTELFYRWQMTQNLALTPSVQVLFNPAANTEEDTVAVFGLRARVTF